MPIFHSTYHSIQTSLNRRMRNGLQFGVNYTYSISFTGNAGVTRRRPRSRRCGCSTTPTARYSVRADQAEYEELNKNMGNRPHVLKVNAVWELPSSPAIHRR